MLLEVVLMPNTAQIIFTAHSRPLVVGNAQSFHLIWFSIPET